jgi:putative Ca2+/H+ antiporter (TMEM165/GDT1 family)
MDILLFTLFSVLVAEIGDRPQILAAALALRFGNDRTVIAALALAAGLNCTLSAAAGSVIDEWISEDPLRLFNGLAYFLAGLGMLMWRRRVELLQEWKIGPFLTAFFGLFILQFGDKGQFIIAANAAMTPHWGFAALGGWMGIMSGIVPAIVLKERLASRLPIPTLRIAGGVMMLLWGVVQAVRAWRIL